MYLLEPSLAAALLDELFEHPAGGSHYSASGEDHRGSSVATLFFRSLQVICVREELFVKARECGVGGANHASTKRFTRLATDSGYWQGGTDECPTGKNVPTDYSEVSEVWD